LLARIQNTTRPKNRISAAKIIIASCGSITPRELRPAHCFDLDAQINDTGKSHSTRKAYANYVRWWLRWLWEEHGAQKLDGSIRSQVGVRPRNVTITPEERDALLTNAEPWLRLMLMLCEDTAIRSGTAQQLGPRQYDPARRALTFTTKMGERLTLPVTDAIAQLLADCDLSDPAPFIRQLWRKLHKDHASKDDKQPHPRYNAQFVKLRHALGITRKLTFHDLRRTAAVGMYRLTRDLREVQALLGHRSMQSTVWYLDHDLNPVQRTTLELVKQHRKDNAA
jgi:integrase